MRKAPLRFSVRKLAGRTNRELDSLFGSNLFPVPQSHIRRLECRKLHENRQISLWAQNWWVFSDRNSLYYSLLVGNSSGEEFARDSVLRQQVSIAEKFCDA